MKTREAVQKEAKEAAIQSLSTIGKASLKVGTGVGKGKIMLDILAHFNPPKITWLIDSVDGRDNTDPSEFIKWGYEYLLERTTFACYDSARTWEGQDLGFLVGNEADYSAAEVRSKVYFNNTYDKILLVTATIVEDKQWLFNQIAPVVYTLSTQDAQDLGILNKTKFIFVDYLLGTTKDYKMGNKDRSWFSSENEQYVYWDSQYTSALIQYYKVANIISDHFSGKEIVENFNYNVLKAEKLRHNKQMKFFAAKRANVLQNLKSSIVLAKKIGKEILENPVNKVVLFATLTSQIDASCKYTHHSKNNNPQYIDMLNNGVIRAMGVCGKINRGTNLVGVNNFIYIDINGSQTVGSQRAGRATRLDSNDIANLYIFRPYFKKKVKIKNDVGYTMVERIYPTRMVAWAETAFSDFNINDSNSEVKQLW